MKILQEKVTIEYARKKLGKSGTKITNKQIADLVSTLRLLCNNVIDNVIVASQKYEN